MTLDDAIKAIEDLIESFPDDIYVEALGEMEDRARTAREAKEAEDREAGA
jgi:hypothetical protein